MVSGLMIGVVPAQEPQRKDKKRLVSAQTNAAVTMVFTDLVNATAIKGELPGADATARHRLYFDTILFDTILAPHRQ